MPPPCREWLPANLTVAQARRALAERLRQSGIESPELDARVLTGHALGLDRTALVREADRGLSDPEACALAALAARRLEQEPVARILGAKEFWGLPLRVSEATLVPRPETETVVEEALAAIDRDGARARPLRVADLGTGSGALLIALLHELPNAFGIGTDRSTEAIAVARDNAERHGMDARARFAICNFAAALRQGFDVVVSNPPYVASGEIASLPPEVRHDPRLALDGGADGLAAYCAIARQAGELLAPGGHLVIEMGYGQQQAVAGLFESQGLQVVASRADLAGVPRALRARLPQ